MSRGALFLLLFRGGCSILSKVGEGSFSPIELPFGIILKMVAQFHNKYYLTGEESVFQEPTHAGF